MKKKMSKWMYLWMVLSLIFGVCLFASAWLQWQFLNWQASITYVDIPMLQGEIALIAKPITGLMADQEGLRKLAQLQRQLAIAMQTSNMMSVGYAAVALLHLLAWALCSGALYLVGRLIGWAARSLWPGRRASV